MMRVLQYAFEEAVASLWRGRRAALPSAAIIATALFVLGGVLLITLNLERLGAEWSRASGMSVYLEDEASPAIRADIEQALAPGPDTVVAGYEFVSKAEAVKRFKETFSDLAATIDALDSNPLPASYEVRIKPSPDARAAVERLGGRLRQTAGVSDVRYDRQWIDRLLATMSILRTVGLALSAVLAMAAALTVANVVRLALYARRDEIAIMQLVGAPQAYIRGPFVMEGVLQGGIGAVVALTVLGAGYLGVRGRYLAPLAAALNLSSIRFLTPELSALMIVGGMLVGCIGGIAAARGRT
jgi:cell division transport system permease protein